MENDSAESRMAQEILSLRRNLQEVRSAHDRLTQSLASQREQEEDIERRYYLRDTHYHELYLLLSDLVTSVIASWKFMRANGIAISEADDQLIDDVLARKQEFNNTEKILRELPPNQIQTLDLLEAQIKRAYDLKSELSSIVTMQQNQTKLHGLLGSDNDIESK